MQGGGGHQLHHPNRQDAYGLSHQQLYPLKLVFLAQGLAWAILNDGMLVLREGASAPTGKADRQIAVLRLSG